MLALFGAEATDGLAVATHVEQRRGHLPIERVVLRDAQVGEAVLVAVGPLQRRRLAGLERCLGLSLERHTRERDEKQHDRDVHDVATVAPAIAGEQLHQRHRNRLAVLPMPGTRPARELLDHGPEYETADAEGHQRADIAHSRNQ